MNLSSFLTLEHLLSHLLNWGINPKEAPQSLGQNILHWQLAVKWDAHKGWNVGTVAEAHPAQQMEYWVDFDGWKELFKVGLPHTLHVDVHTCEAEPKVDSFFSSTLKSTANGYLRPSVTNFK